MSMDREDFWRKELHRIMTTTHPAHWAKELMDALRTHGAPPESCLGITGSMIARSADESGKPMFEIPKEAKPYQEALARERALVVKLHDKETDLASARMGEQNAMRELDRWKTLKHLEGFLAEVDDEVARARKLHKPINSAHEGHSVILEEVEEFWDEVKMKREARNPERMWHELVQVAAMALRTAEDVVKPQIK